MMQQGGVSEGVRGTRKLLCNDVWDVLGRVGRRMVGAVCLAIAQHASEV